MLIDVGVSCRILNSFVSYLYVSCSGSIPRLGQIHVGRVPLLGARIGCFIILRHSLGLPYNYFYLKRQRATKVVNSNTEQGCMLL